MNTQTVKIPCYVLLETKERIGPKLLDSATGRVVIAIYGFSDKTPYDAFCENSALQLTPYPLVKMYLRDQIAEAVDAETLIAVDASGPHQPTLDAVTMSSVLHALENHESEVPISFRLIFDEAAQAYQREPDSSAPLRVPADPIPANVPQA